MAHTVQSFIDTLRADGVEAGRKAAEEIRREAERQSEQLIREAEAKASRIVEEAERQRQETVERTRIDLELAARDTVAKLRDALSQAVNRVLGRAVSEAFDDVDFLKDLIREIACNYAQSDAAGEQRIELRVSEPMRRKLADWAIATFHTPCDDRRLSLELHGALSTAGFEYKVSGGTVEVTPDSVVQVLSEIVTPQLQQLLASSQEGQASEPT
jgi:vacuolar-type H+-ATPase subunit H